MTARSACTWARGCLLGSLLGGPLVGCAGDTGSERFAFEAFAAGTASASAPLTFTNALGWSITLTRADVTLGPLYLNVVPPLRAPSTLLDWLIPTAYAQAEHLAEGRIVGEVLGQAHFSALSPELVAFSAPGMLTAEQVRTAEVWFYPEPGVAPETTNITSAALTLEGQATRAGQTLAFRGVLVLDGDWLGTAPAGSRGNTSITDVRQMRGIDAEFVPREGGHLELRFDITAPLRGADFTALAASPTDADGAKRLVQARAGRDQVMTNLYQGLTAAEGSYAVRWVDP